MNLPILLQQNTLAIIALVIVIIAVLFNVLLLILFFLNRQNHMVQYNRFSLNILKYWIYYESAILVPLIAISILTVCLMPKVIAPSGPITEAIELSKNKPLKIEFDRPFNKKSIKPVISPELNGEWKLSSGVLKRKSSLTFIPQVTPKSDTTYTVSIGGIKNVLAKKTNSYLFSFPTTPASELKKISVNDGDQGILPNQEIDIEITNPSSQTVEFTFETAPPVELSVDKTVTGYRLKAKASWQKGIEYTLKVSRNLVEYNYDSGQKISEGEKTEVKSLKFRTVDSTGVAKTSPSGNDVLTDSAIVIEFRQDMDPASTESAFSVTPKISGVFSWQDKRKLTFKPDKNLDKNAKYKVAVSTSAKVADNSSLDEASSFEFITIGYVLVSKFSPGNSATGIDLGTAISITFNQAVDHASAESKFSILPTIAGTFRWTNNMMTFSQAGLVYNQKYTISIAQGIKSLAGLDSIEPLSSSFTTRAQSVTLNVPSYRQQRLYSCMATAARNALAFKGVAVAEDTLLNLMGYDTTAWSGDWQNPNGDNVWGDPDIAIVGDVNGKTAPGWGYGAHWGPTARAISQYRQTEVKTGWNVSGIAQAITDGNPVLVWWVNGVWPAYEVAWHTPSGKAVSGVNSMHVQVVKGFTGSIEDPTSFSVTDSGYGYPGKTFDVQTFKAKWNWFGNSAVIVK